MSRAKKIFIGFICLVLCSVTACGHKRILLETGENPAAEDFRDETAETENRLLEDDSGSLIYVYVCGQVQKPGVYSMKKGDRMFQAVELAGGILQTGDAAGVNLAEPLYDGQKIYIPSFDEAETGRREETAEEDASDGLVNINRASKEVLMTLPGIGETKADAIVTYRQENGIFDSLEALMNVPGIKEGVYSKIKDRITID